MSSAAVDLRLAAARRVLAQTSQHLGLVVPAQRPPGGSARPGVVSTGIAPLDLALHGGLPRGRISELSGARSSGRMAVTLHLLSHASSAGEPVAATVVDGAVRWPLIVHPDGSFIEATALGVEDKEWGHRLRAFVVRAEHAGQLDEATIKTYVKENLARYKVPRDVVFLDELPRNPTGKILKRELREKYPD